MPFDGPNAQHESCRDFSITVSGRKKPQHLNLAVAQASGVIGGFTRLGFGARFIGNQPFSEGFHPQFGAVTGAFAE